MQSLSYNLCAVAELLEGPSNLNVCKTSLSAGRGPGVTGVWLHMPGRAGSKVWVWNPGGGQGEYREGTGGAAQSPNASRSVQGDHEILQGSCGGPGLTQASQ